MPRIGSSAPPASGGGSGNVIGPGSSTDKAIVRWDGTTGTYIQDSPGTYVQDGGAVEAQGFITKRVIDTNVTVPGGYTWIAPNIELDVGGSIVIDPNGQLLIV
jgi:hypothetical protein